MKSKYNAQINKCNSDESILKSAILSQQRAKEVSNVYRSNLLKKHAMKKVADISALPENADEDFSHEQQDSVENVLKLVKNGTHLSVANIECSPGSQQGDNYMSIIKRIQVRGKRRLCNGKSKGRCEIAMSRSM